MNPFEEILLPYQKQIFNDPSDFICLNCSRQVGKSLTLAAKAVYEALTNPKSLACVISVNERSAQEFLRKILQWSDACRIAAPKLVDYTSNATSVTFSNGSRIITLPSSPSSLRGFSGSIYWDEAALCENDKEMWAALMPIITSKMSGEKKICISSTPTSLDTIFSQIWHSDDYRWSKHQITIYDAVGQGLKADPDTLKSVINDDLIWNTEYCCQFAQGACGAFPTDQIQTYDDMPDDSSRWLGFDVARRNDYSVISICGYDRASKDFFVENIIRLKDVPFNEQLDIIRELNGRYNIVGGLVDSVGVGSMLAEEITRTISPKIKGFSWSASNKTELHDNLRSCMTNGNFKVNSEFEQMIKNDMLNMRRYVSNTGRISYNAPHNSDGHSDITSSIVLAYHSVRENPINFQNPITYSRYSAFGERKHRLN